MPTIKDTVTNPRFLKDEELGRIRKDKELTTTTSLAPATTTTTTTTTTTNPTTGRVTTTQVTTVATTTPTTTPTTTATSTATTTPTSTTSTRTTVTTTKLETKTPTPTTTPSTSTSTSAPFTFSTSTTTSVDGSDPVTTQPKTTVTGNISTTPDGNTTITPAINASSTTTASSSRSSSQPSSASSSSSYVPTPTFNPVTTHSSTAGITSATTGAITSETPNQSGGGSGGNATAIGVGSGLGSLGLLATAVIAWWYKRGADKRVNRREARAALEGTPLVDMTTNPLHTVTHTVTLTTAELSAAGLEDKPGNRKLASELKRIGVALTAKNVTSARFILNAQIREGNPRFDFNDHSAAAHAIIFANTVSLFQSREFFEQAVSRYNRRIDVQKTTRAGGPKRRPITIEEAVAVPAATYYSVPMEGDESLYQVAGQQPDASAYLVPTPLQGDDFYAISSADAGPTDHTYAVGNDDEPDYDNLSENISAAARRQSSSQRAAPSYAVGGTYEYMDVGSDSDDDGQEFFDAEDGRFEQQLDVAFGEVPTYETPVAAANQYEMPAQQQQYYEANLGGAESQYYETSTVRAAASGYYQAGFGDDDVQYEMRPEQQRRRMELPPLPGTPDEAYTALSSHTTYGASVADPYTVLEGPHDTYGASATDEGDFGFDDPEKGTIIYDSTKGMPTQPALPSTDIYASSTKQAARGRVAAATAPQYLVPVAAANNTDDDDDYELVDTDEDISRPPSPATQAKKVIRTKKEEETTHDV